MSQQVSDMRKEVLAAEVNKGTEVKTTFMQKFVTKADSRGFYMMDADLTLGRIRTAARMIARRGCENLIVCTGRQNAHRPAGMMADAIGAKALLGRFMPGTLTNPSLPYYIEPKLVMISDPQVDAQAIVEATNAGIPVIGMASTDNITSNVDLVIPANNRGRRSLATVYWMLAGETRREKKIKEIEDRKKERAADGGEPVGEQADGGEPIEGQAGAEEPIEGLMEHSIDDFAAKVTDDEE